MARVLGALAAIVPTSVVWRQGLLHPGGPHRRLADSLDPISIGEDECAVFRRLIEHFRPAHCFIIGNAFGLSSAYIAATMQAHGGQSVVTLDSQSEGEGEHCARIARELAEALKLGILTNKKGWSPKDIGASVEQPSYDLIFIDGAHRHPQVTHDLDGVLPIANDQSLLVWHDYWIRGVPESVQRAQRLGFRTLWLPTSCEMVLGVRDAERFELLRAAFPEGREHFSHLNYGLGYLLHLKTVAGFHVERALKSFGASL